MDSGNMQEEESLVSEVVDESPPSSIFYLEEESGDEDVVEEDARAAEAWFGVEGFQPYMFEPLPRNAASSVSSTPAEDTDVHPREHWDATQWERKGFLFQPLRILAAT